MAVCDYTVALETDPDLESLKRIEVCNSHAFLDHFVYKVRDRVAVVVVLVLVIIVVVSATV